MSNLITASSTVGRLKYCCKYPSCGNSYFTNIIQNHYTNKKFYKFPKNSETLQVWKNICNVQVNSCDNFRVCEDHFIASDFFNSSRNCLKPESIPKPVKFTVQPSPLPSTSFSERTQEETVLNEEESDITGIIYCDHDYSTSTHFSKPACLDQFSFLSDKNTGILSQAGLSEKDLSPQKAIMYKVHRNVTSKLSKLRSLLKDTRAHLTTIRDLYNENRFKFIEENVNNVTKEFVNSQLRNATRTPSGRRWTMQDKAFALSVYKRGPRLYRYLNAHLQLPSIRTLKNVLSKIPFETGINKTVLEHLKLRVEKMNDRDRYCTLIFDEMSLSSGFYYENHKQRICGFEDLGTLGRTNKCANHALVFMLRGVCKNYKQVVAYYFTHNTISAFSLKKLIVEVIQNLQNIGLHVVATVCDQGPTNRHALSSLCSDNKDKPTSYHFVVNGESICIIFDVPHLLKNTRNALLKYSIQFEKDKCAKFEYIQSAFQLDQHKRTFRQLTKLKSEYFNFKDSFLKMKVKVAAAQLSHTVAASIETFFVSGDLPAESLHTAEFVAMVDCLFDSLNGSNPCPQDGKKFRCALSADSPHLEFWSDILQNITNWKLIDPSNGKNCTNLVHFLKGWQITIRSVIFLWNNLRQKGVRYLSLRSLNQDPLENLFCQIRQHGICNTNPTCHQFIAALKTVVINNFAVPLTRGKNCEEDYCESLGDLCSFLSQNYSPENFESGDIFDNDPNIDIALEENQASSYVAGYILKKISIPECATCKEHLFSSNVTNRHLFVSLKEESDDMFRLNYASDRLIDLVDTIHICLYQFLDKNGHKYPIESNFKTSNAELLNTFEFCDIHNCKDEIIQKCITLTIYKWVREKKAIRQFSNGHSRKIKKLKTN